MCVCSSGSGRGRIECKDDVAVFLPSRGLHSGKKNQGQHHHLERSCQPAFKAVGVRGAPSVTCRLLLTVQERWVRGLFCCFLQSLFSHWCWLAYQHPGLIPPLLVPWGNDRRVLQLPRNPEQPLYLQAQSTRGCKTNETPFIVVYSAYQTRNWTAEERTSFPGIFQFWVQPEGCETAPLRPE